MKEGDKTKGFLNEDNSLHVNMYESDLLATVE